MERLYRTRFPGHRARRDDDDPPVRVRWENHVVGGYPHRTPLLKSSLW